MRPPSPRGAAGAGMRRNAMLYVALGAVVGLGMLAMRATARPATISTGAGARGADPSLRAAAATNSGAIAAAFDCKSCARGSAWHAFAARLDAEAVEAAAAHAAVDLVFLGDSITEAYRGTSVGHTCGRGRCDGVPEAFAAEYRAHGAAVVVQGLSGDSTSHLRWRMARPGLAAALRKARTAVVHIGTNDLSWMIPTTGDWKAPGAVAYPEDAVARDAEALVQRITQVVGDVQRAVPAGGAGGIIVLGILPRGPTFPKEITWPNDVFTPVITAVNAGLAAALAPLPHVTFVDCNAAVSRGFDNGGGARLMPDGLHPSAEGYAPIFACLRPHIQRVNPGVFRN